jgi:hypothetical protein
MIIELKTFEDMSAAEQRQHLLEIFSVDDGSVGPEDWEELKKIFRKERIRQPKSERRGYLTCNELAELVGRSADTIRKLFINDKGVEKRTTSGRNRKPYTTMLISRVAAKRRFPDLALLKRSQSAYLGAMAASPVRVFAVMLLLVARR